LNGDIISNLKVHRITDVDSKVKGDSNSTVRCDGFRQKLHHVNRPEALQSGTWYVELARDYACCVTLEGSTSFLSSSICCLTITSLMCPNSAEKSGDNGWKNWGGTFKCNVTCGCLDFNSVFDLVFYSTFYSAVRFRQKTFKGLVSTMPWYQTAYDSRVPSGVPWGVTFEASSLMDVWTLLGFPGG